MINELLEIELKKINQKLYTHERWIKDILIEYYNLPSICYRILNNADNIVNLTDRLMKDIDNDKLLNKVKRSNAELKVIKSTMSSLLDNFKKLTECN